MLDAISILDFKSKLQVMIPHLQAMQSTAYSHKENVIAKYASLALNAMYSIELDLDKSKPFTQAEYNEALEVLKHVEQ